MKSATVTVSDTHGFHVGDTIVIHNPDTRWWRVIYFFIRYSELPPALREYFTITQDVTSSSFTIGDMQP